MKLNTLVTLSIATITALSIAPANAAPRSISGAIGIVAPAIERVNFPEVGVLGKVSLMTVGELPGLSSIKLPIFGGIGGVPFVGGVTVSQGVQIVQSVAVLQAPLPGFGVIDSVLAKMVK